MKYIALHHTTVSSSIPQLLAVNRHHKRKWGDKSERGWYVGYNYFTERSGTRIQTRNIGEETIANKGHNCDIEERCDTISYCMAGDFNIERPTVAQLNDFQDFISEMRQKYPNIEIVGHKDLQKARTCPGRLITKEDFEGWNSVEEDEDAEKKEIARLTSILDILMARLRVMLAQLRG